MARKTIAQLEAELAALKAQAEPKAERNVVPTLSCWNLASERVTDNGDGTLSYVNRKGQTARYAIISEADAKKLVSAHVKSGKVFAVRMPK
jgi:hypothetical protein